MIFSFTRGNYQSVYWAMCKAIEKNLLNSGAIIFGGYVRDRIIHDHYADMFYTAADASETPLDYNDPKCHPDSWPHRTHLPADIDAVMSNDAFDTFIENMKEQDFIVKKKRTTNISAYTCRVPDLLHTKCTVMLKTHPIMRNLPLFTSCLPVVELDILHKQSLSPTECVPYGTIDFECNSLLILPGNTIDIRNGAHHFCTEKFKQINKIMSDIVEFRAVAVNPQNYRICKMLEKGFELSNHAIKLIPCEIAKKYDGLCLICHEDFEQCKAFCQVQNTCCDARYHVHCYAASRGRIDSPYDNVQNCMMCRQAMSRTHNMDMYLNHYSYRIMFQQQSVRRAIRGDSISDDIPEDDSGVDSP